MAKSFLSNLETELLGRRRYALQAEVRMACLSNIKGLVSSRPPAFQPGLPLAHDP